MKKQSEDELEREKAAVLGAMAAGPADSIGSRARDAISGAPPAGEGEARIEYMRIDRVPPAPRNAKKHDLVAIRRSFKAFGFINPPIVNEASGRLVAGHGRIEELVSMHAKRRPPPKRIRVDDEGFWWVPVIRGIAFDSDEQAELYVLADNKIGEDQGYENDILAEIMRDHSKDALEIAGFDSKEVDAMLEPPIDIDATRSSPAKDTAEAFIFREVRILLSEETANRLGSVIEQYSEQRGTYNGFVEFVLDRVNGGGDV